MSYYANSIDKNSGMTEVRIITDELEKIKTNKKVLVIINGIRDEDDNCLLEEIKKYDLSIFIMSDSIALETSLDIMNACDYVLHQAPYHDFDKIKASQMYSYVPELFYKYCKNLVSDGEINVEKTENPNIIYFGGNNKNRDDKFKAYKINESPKIFSRYKLYETGEDTRISHIDYLKELAKFTYSLVICREDYREIGWLTSRYFEAIALDNIPLIDMEYDIGEYLISRQNILRVHDYESLMEIQKDLYHNPRMAKHILIRHKQNVENRLDRFRHLVEKIINR